MAKDAIVDQGIITSEMREKVNIIKEQLSLDEKKGVVTANKGTFEKTLPEGLSMDAVKSTMKAITDYGVASRVAFSEVALKGLKDNPDLERISGNIPVYKGVTYGHTMDRLKTGTKPGSTGETYEKHGDGRTVLKISAISNSRETMKSINSFFSEESAKALSGKKK